jgi:Flp pilus assembly protein TadG
MDPAAMRAMNLFREERGASAVEFALVIGPFVGIVLSTIMLGAMFWANQTLKYAAADAARCAAVRTSICSDKTTTESYAASHYSGPGLSPTFTYSPSGCGHTVTASATFPLNTGLVDLSIPLSAHACFPLNIPPSS